MKIAREQYEKFNEAFNKVFTTNNEIKNCGREKCEELIDIADLIEKDKKHGDSLTGRMNIHSILNLKIKLEEKF